MTELQLFAAHILENHLDKMASLYLSRAKELQLPMLQSISEHTEPHMFALVRQSTLDTLDSLVAGKFQEVVYRNIDLWKADQLPGISRTQPGLHDLILIISIRKYSFIKLLPEYTQEITQGTSILLELDEYYDFYREKLYETYIAIQQEELIQEKEFIETILDTTTEGISALNTNMEVTVWNRSLAQRTGVGKEDILGKYVFDLFPQSMQGEEYNAIQRALAGERVRLKSQPLRIREGFYDSEIIPMRNPEGMIIGTLTISRDITAQKKQEESLNRALEYYLILLDDFPTMIWRSNNLGKLNYFNKSWLYYTGKNVEQEADYGWTEGVHPEDVQQCLQIYNNSFREKNPFVREYRLRKADGAYHWIMDFGKPMYDLKGIFMGYLGACFDIQERKDAEKAIRDTNQELIATLEELKKTQELLRQSNAELEKKVDERTRKLTESEKQLKQMLENTLKLNQTLAENENFLSNILDQTPVSTWIADAKGTQVRVNQACTRLFGVEDAALGVGRYNILQDETLKDKPFYKDIQAVFTEGKIARFSLYYNISKVDHVDIPTGRDIHLVVTIFPIRNASGQVTHAVIQHEDITERIRSEQALRASNEQLRTITDALPVLISHIDAGMKYTFVNKAYTSWFKKPTEEIINRPVWELMGEQAYQKVKGRIDKALAGEKVHYEDFIPYQYGGHKHTITTMVPHRENGKIIGIFAMVTDATSLRQAQAALIEKNEELIRINNDLDNFIYTASHDLKSPIVNLEGLIMALDRTVHNILQEREQKLVEMMRLSVHKLKNTINYLSDVVKITKSPEENQEVIDIPAVIREVKTDIAPLLAEGKPELIEDYQLGSVKMVREKFKSIAYNLISNAVKYRRVDVPLIIRLKTYEEDAYLVFSVEDNGLGMLPQQQAKLFMLFKRMHTHVEGSGIGLYIVKRIIENIKGKVLVESVPKQGTVFKVYLPLQKKL